MDRRRSTKGTDYRKRGERCWCSRRDFEDFAFQAAAAGDGGEVEEVVGFSFERWRGGARDL